MRNRDRERQKRDLTVIEQIEGKKCTVHAFNDTYAPKKDVKVCNVAFAFDTVDGKTYVIKVNQCLNFTSEMKDSLLCTNQVRANGIIVEDVPNRFDVLQTSRQAIILPDKDIVLPLEMSGPVPYLPVRRVTKEELESCEWLELTGELPWEPNANDEDHKMVQEVCVEDKDGRIELPEKIVRSVIIHGVTYTYSGELDPSRLSRI